MAAKNITIGLKILLWGYFCKLIIADKIALIISPIFNSYIEQDGLSISIAVLLYSFQIYFDFWGYSLIAIGIGRILGFSININFANPYIAKSFKIFWHKWHITLSKWMRDYIYIPLGGNKQKNYLLFCLSILATFIISGFWHGITFNFILWGVIHALLYIAEDLFTSRFALDRLGYLRKFIQPFLAILFFILISLTWLIFRTNDTSELIKISTRIFSFHHWSFNRMVNHYFSFPNIIYLTFILASIIFIIPKIPSLFTSSNQISRKGLIVDSIFVCISIIVLILWGDIGGQEFLYFQF